MVWKIRTAQVMEKIFYSLISCRLFSEKQKGCRKGTRGTRELVFIDQHILIHTKRWRINRAMAWIDHKKSIWHGPAKLDNRLSQNVRGIRWSHNVYRDTMENWRLELTAGDISLTGVKIQRGIFQGDALSLLLFVIVMMLLSHILRKCILSCVQKKSSSSLKNVI